MGQKRIEESTSGIEGEQKKLFCFPDDPINQKAKELRKQLEEETKK